MQGLRKLASRRPHDAAAELGWALSLYLDSQAYADVQTVSSGHHGRALSARCSLSRNHIVSSLRKWNQTWSAH